MTERIGIFDPRRNFQLQGFTGRGATTTLHDATATGVSISGIFQGAEDFAVLELYHAYDYYNHLRLKHLPRTDLSGITLSFDIEYDHDRHTQAIHVAQKIADIINTQNSGDVAGRFGPDQSSVIKATVGGGTTYQSGTLYLEFQPSTADGSIYGRLGNLDRIVVTQGRTVGGVEDMQQGFKWTDGSGTNYRFMGGDNTIRYHVELPFDTLTDKNGVAITANHCWKIYMVFATRFERAEEELEDGCFLTARSIPATPHGAWTTVRSSLAGGTSSERQPARSASCSWPAARQASASSVAMKARRLAPGPRARASRSSRPTAASRPTWSGARSSRTSAMRPPPRPRARWSCATDRREPASRASPPTTCGRTSTRT